MSASTLCGVLRTFCRIDKQRLVFRSICANKKLNQQDSTSSNLSEEEHTGVEISSEDFKFAEKLLPQRTVPDPPKHASYPTPSGWVPPRGDLSLPYFINRTKNHMLPVYLEVRNGGTRKLVKIGKIDGDIWAFEADIRKYLEKASGKMVVTQVHEVGRFIRIKGLHIDNVAKFLLEKGF